MKFLFLIDKIIDGLFYVLKIEVNAGIKLEVDAKFTFIG